MVFRLAGRIVVPFVLVVAGATASWAAPPPPVPDPVRDNPHVVEGASTAHGGWIGWAQHPEGTSEPGDFYVQRGTAAPIKVNAARTHGLGGGIVGHSVYYAQKLGDRAPRINRFDLRSGHRTPLPAKVNHYRHVEHHPCCGLPAESHVMSEVRGNATVSGPWLLYSGQTWDLPRGDNFLLYTVVLYNRGTHELRTLAENMYDGRALWAGQVNGNYATYWSFDDRSTVNRYDLKTKRTVELSRPEGGDAYDPAVSSDGTVYYFLTDDDAPSGGPSTTELVRQPVDGSAEVVTTLTSERGQGPGETFVKDRANGSRVVFFSWKGGVYKIVDGP